MGATAAMAAIAIGGTLYNEDRADARADDIQEAQEERSKSQAGIRASQAARVRRTQIQKAMLARAKSENAAASQGVGGSTSAIQGSVGATAQAGGNISDINTQVANQETLEAANQNILNAQNQRPGVGEQVVGAVSNQFVGQLATSAGESLFKD